MSSSTSSARSSACRAVDDLASGRIDLAEFLRRLDEVPAKPAVQVEVWLPALPPRAQRALRVIEAL